MDLVRERASWMTAVDDRILEALAVYDGLRLFSLHRRLHRDGDGAPPVGYLLLRCKRLRESRLVVQRDGYFRLTSTGRAYLNGEVDVERIAPDGSRVADAEREPQGES
jgi:hypothetical protein